MKHQSAKDFSTVSTSGVENYVENVETVENLKNHVENPTKSRLSCTKPQWQEWKGTSKDCGLP